MTDGILYRLRHVFDDTDEVMEWIDTSTYDGAETYDHVSGMHKTMLDAADYIEKLEKALLSVSALNNHSVSTGDYGAGRDRFSSEIDKIILDALKDKKDVQPLATFSTSI